MKFAALALLAFGFSIPAGFASPITPLSQSPQQVPVILSDLGAPILDITSQESSFVLYIAEEEGECGDSDNDGECDQGGSMD